MLSLLVTCHDCVDVSRISIALALVARTPSCIKVSHIDKRALNGLGALHLPVYGQGATAGASCRLAGRDAMFSLLYVLVPCPFLVNQYVFCVEVENMVRMTRRSCIWRFVVSIPLITVNTQWAKLVHLSDCVLVFSRSRLLKNQ